MYRTRNLPLTDLQEDDPIYTNNNAGNEVHTVRAITSSNDGTYVDDDHEQRGQGETYQSHGSYCGNFADAGTQRRKGVATPRDPKVILMSLRTAVPSISMKSRKSMMMVNSSMET